MIECDPDHKRDERSFSSDDTEFMDLPLPPVPSTARAVEIHNLTGVTNTNTAPYLFSRMDDFDIAPRQSPEDVSSSTLSSPTSSSVSDLDENTPQNTSKWSSSDEETSFYRDKLSCFRSDSSTPNNYLDDVRKVNRYANKGNFLVLCCFANQNVARLFRHLFNEILKFKCMRNLTYTHYNIYQMIQLVVMKTLPGFDPIKRQNNRILP